ncbi:unnamed protein product [Allacma fusca]|uniref:Uncharacterized protein n=1 Tax=Allacma fusca TaxID=39272 RepID=A0A8J2P2U6_9HEXA|nr:unnamed protein product [Allacma fusca]
MDQKIFLALLIVLIGVTLHMKCVIADDSSSSEETRSMGDSPSKRKVPHNSQGRKWPKKNDSSAAEGHISKFKNITQRLDELSAGFELLKADVEILKQNAAPKAQNDTKSGLSAATDQVKSAFSSLAQNFKDLTAPTQ